MDARPTAQDVDDIVTSLHRLEVILEEIASDLSDISAEVAWRSLPRWQRLLLRLRKPAKTDMLLYGSESNADGRDPQP